MTQKIPSVFSLLIWAALWEILARILQTDILPPPTAIALAATELVQLKSFQNAFLVTARAFLIGMALALVIGIPAGVALGRFKAVDRIFNVWVNIFLSAPLTAVIPALMPLLGIGQATVVATVFLFAVWVIIIDTQAGIRSVSPSLVEMARMHGATRAQMFFKIFLPSAMPEVMIGIRLGVVRGIKGVIIGQIVIALIGFGELFETYLQSFAMERFWALVLIVFAIAFAIVQIVAIIEKRLTFYATAR